MKDVVLEIGSVVLDGLDPHVAHHLRRHLTAELEAWAQTLDPAELGAGRTVRVNLDSWRPGREARAVVDGIAGAVEGRGDRS